MNTEEWQLYVDGASNSRSSSTGMVLITPEGAIIERVVTLGFAASNTEAEYEALLSGLRAARGLAIKRLVVHCDSKLVANRKRENTQLTMIGWLHTLVKHNV